MVLPCGVPALVWVVAGWVVVVLVVSILLEWSGGGWSSVVLFPIGILGGAFCTWLVVVQPDLPGPQALPTACTLH